MDKHPWGQDKYKICEEQGCTEKFKNHAWGHIQAEGWFIQKSGIVWCPKHIPDWVSEWRKKQAKKTNLPNKE